VNFTDITSFYVHQMDSSIRNRLIKLFKNCNTFDVNLFEIEGRLWSDNIIFTKKYDMAIIRYPYLEF